MKLNIAEKEKLNEMFTNVERFSFTTDMWTSNQTIGYMYLKGHLLDSEWMLQICILNLCGLAPPHSGAAIANDIFLSSRLGN